MREAEIGMMRMRQWMEVGGLEKAVGRVLLLRGALLGREDGAWRSSVAGGCCGAVAEQPRDVEGMLR